MSGDEELHTGWLTGVLLEFARGGAEWVLWLLVVLSLVAIAIFLERLSFFRRTRAEVEPMRALLIQRIDEGRMDALLEQLRGNESMQARVVAYGLRDAERGPESVEELCRGAIGMEKLRYERGLSVLATIGSNAPFIGLFGTVMGVIMAFDQLRGIDGFEATGQSSAVMGAIAEALIATGVGLLVAIPAILFFNILKGNMKTRIAETQLLVETMVSRIRSLQRTPPPALEE
jgi:biopolymer transport protein ExbB/TolQ